MRLLFIGLLLSFSTNVFASPSCEQVLKVCQQQQESIFRAMSKAGQDKEPLQNLLRDFQQSCGERITESCAGAT